MQDKVLKLLLYEIRHVDYWRVLTLVLILGWSYLLAPIGFRLYEQFTINALQQDQEIILIYKKPKSTAKAVQAFSKAMFDNSDIYFKDTITKKQFLSKVNNARGIRIVTTNKTDYSSIYLGLLILFLFWLLPILLILLAGIYMKGTKHTPIYDD